MKKYLKKIMISSAAILMFASVGTAGSNMDVSAHHVRTHRSYSHKHNVHKYDLKRSKHLRDVHKFHVYRNRRLKTFNALQHTKNWWHKNTRAFKKIVKMNKQTYYQGYNRVNNRAYHQGYRDANGATNNKDPYNTFDIKYKHSKQYKAGFIYAYQYSNLFRPYHHKDAVFLYNYNKKHYNQGGKDWFVKHNPKSAEYFGSTF